MLGYTELNADTTKNHPALTSYFTNPSFKNAVLLEIPLSSRKYDNVSIITTMCAMPMMFEPAIFVRREWTTSSGYCNASTHQYYIYLTKSCTYYLNKQILAFSEH